MEKLKSRQLLFPCTLFLIALFQIVSGQQKDGTLKPEVQLQSEDYSKARSKFQTSLIRQGPSPQKTIVSDSADVPAPGVTEVLFSSGNLTLKAWMNSPDTTCNTQYPVVVFLHGGFAFGKGDWDMTKPFRDAGFIVIAPMLRGENGQQGTFTLFYDEVNDVIAAIEYAQQQTFTNKKRIYLAGHSVGGTLTLLTAMISKSICKASSFSASPDQILYCRYGIDPNMIPFDTANPKEFQVRSPLAYAGSFKCPVRIFYGTQEPHFRKSSQQTAAIAKESKMDAEAIEVEGGHMSALEGEIKLAIKFFKEK
jgi:dipeptidyl aminopeptidase/acylaminoacyl peptidase